MAVYFEPKSPSWMDYAAPVIQNLLGGLVGGMFDRDKQARDLKFQERTATAEESRKRAASEFVLNKLGFGGPGAGPNGTPTLNMRGDPNRSVYELAAISHLVPDADIKAILESENPNMSAVETDTGGRKIRASQNPLTGDFLNETTYDKTVDPAKVFEAKSAMELQNAADRAANYRAGVAADKNGKAQLKQDASGKWYWVKPGEKATEAGVQGSPATPKREYLDPIGSYKLDIIKETLKTTFNANERAMLLKQANEILAKMEAERDGGGDGGEPIVDYDSSTKVFR
jgi:hypothetical protein